MSQYLVNYLQFFGTILTISCGGGGYNLDVKGSVLFSDPRGRSHNRGSYFGFTVALYPSPSDALVIVGAPRANVSRLPGIREPGAVYYCYLSGTCKEWILHKSTNGEVKGLNYVNQRLDGAWIGGTISVANDVHPEVVICAPRWTNVIRDIYYMNGICYYTIANSTRAFERPVDSIINVFAGRDYQVATDSRGVPYHLWGMSMLGFSLHEFRDLDRRHHFMCGTPGYYASRGNALLFSRNGKKTETILPPMIDIPRARRIGYSTTSGFYFDAKRKDRWYVVSALDRLSLAAAVLIFHFQGNRSVYDGLTVGGNDVGELFGASLTSCDVDNDRRDDLIVGAPTWSDNVDEGRIYIFSARRNSIGFERRWIDGKFEGAQFGSSVVCLGDLDRDGYGDVAVGAPYEDKSGAVYIFNGGRYGLSRVPSQKILGKDFGRLSGFGLSISEPRDVDGNGYPDVAVGAYRSGHAVLFRAQPVVEVNISLSSVDSARLNRTTTNFSIKFCGYYDGYMVPTALRVVRIFRIDEAYQRARLATHANVNGTYQLEDVLYYRKVLCTEIPIVMDGGTKTEPLDISVSLKLLNNEPLVGFCRRCPRINQKRSIIEKSLRLNFELDCGPDNVCHSNLTLGVSTSLGESNEYILGNRNIVDISIDIRNYGEPGYDTRVRVLLPEFIVLTRVPSSASYQCIEEPVLNGSVQVICELGNPFRVQTTLKLELDMSQLTTESQFYADSIDVPISLTTQSRNDNDQNATDNLIIHLVVDSALNITGQAKDNVYSYFSTSEENKLEIIQFDHIYGVQKLGITPIQQAILIVLVPTHLRKSKNEIVEIARINATTVKFFDSINRNDNDYVCQIERVEEKGKKIMERDSNILTQSLNVTLKNRALFLTCENVAIDCVNVTCLIDVPKESVNPSVIAEFKLTIDLLLKDVTDDFTTSKDIIYFVSNGSAMITHPSRAGEKSGMRRNSTLVSTQFLGTPVSAPVASWVIAVSVLVGILLLALLIFVLIKLGFFKRKQKEALDALKADSDNKEGICIETTSSKECLDQD